MTVGLVSAVASHRPPLVQRIERRGKCPGRPTIKLAMPKPPERGALVGPEGIVADRVEWATSFRTRRRGVIGRDQLGPRDALIIRPCRRIHTRGVPYPLDVVFCDRRWRVLHVETVPPERLSRRVWLARSCIELAGGRVGECGIVPGVRLGFREPS